MISCNMFSFIRKANLFTAFTFISFSVFGQELNCNVIVNVGPQVETTERRVFQDMETSFFQFYLKCLKHSSLILAASAVDKSTAFELGQVKGQDIGIRFLISILESIEVELKRRREKGERTTGKD